MAPSSLTMRGRSAKVEWSRRSGRLSLPEPGEGSPRGPWYGESVSVRIAVEGRAAALEALAAGRGAVVWQRMIADVETPDLAALKLIEA